MLLSNLFKNNKMRTLSNLTPLRKRLMVLTKKTNLKETCAQENAKASKN